MMNTKFGFSLFCLIALSAFPVGADLVMIDDFTEPSRTITSKGQQEWVDYTSTVPGGVRDGSVGCESSDALGNTTMKIEGGLFKISTNKSASPSVYLSYDATAGWGSDKDYDPFNGTFSSEL